MKRYIILNKSDMKKLRKNKSVTFFIGDKAYILCTDKCFKKIKSEDKE